MSRATLQPRPLPSAAPRVAAVRQAPPSRWGFPEFFVLSQTVLPALLYLPETQPLRIPIRVSAFGISLAALGWWLLQGRRTGPPHPSRPWLMAALAYLAAQVFHPTTNSFAAGVAQVSLYLAVMAPVFWAPDLVRDCGQVRRLLVILLVCNGVNATVGVLQVYDPDRWLPREFSTVAIQLSGGPLRYTAADGRMVIRPPGLSDNPGAVCGPASVAAALGLIFCASVDLKLWHRAGFFAVAFAGMAALYLSHVRTALLIVVAIIVAYLAVLIWLKERRRAAAFGFVAGAMLFGALLFASSLGGSSVTDRFSTLFEDDPRAVYYKAGRGSQMEHTLTVAVGEFPLGAGLGRWGMMRYYFGNEHNAESPPLWAELQIPAWLLDGGLVLIALYSVALVRTAWYELGVARAGRALRIRRLGAAVFAVNIGTLVLVLGYTPFTNQVGLQYWFLAGILHGLNGSREGPLQ